MAKIWGVPFANAGDKQTIPVPAQPDGTVSTTQGWTPDYELPNTDPSYKPVGRDEMNGILFEITESIQQLQQQGAAEWSADLAPYPNGAEVIHAGQRWVSNVGGNSATPGVGTSWSNTSGFVRSDGTVPFTAPVLGILDGLVGELVTYPYMTERGLSNRARALDNTWANYATVNGGATLLNVIGALAWRSEGDGFVIRDWSDVDPSGVASVAPWVSGSPTLVGHRNDGLGNRGVRVDLATRVATTECRHSGATVEFGSVGSQGATVDLPAGYVMTGIRGIATVGKPDEYGETFARGRKIVVGVDV